MNRSSQIRSFRRSSSPIRWAAICPIWAASRTPGLRFDRKFLQNPVLFDNRRPPTAKSKSEMPSLLLTIAENRASMSSLFTRVGETALNLARIVPDGAPSRPSKYGPRKSGGWRDHVEGMFILVKRRFSLENFALIFSFRFPHMDASSGLAPHSHAAHDPHHHDAGHDHHELPLLAEIHYLDRPQGDRHPVRHHRADFSLLWLFAS